VAMAGPSVLTDPRPATREAPVGVASVAGWLAIPRRGPAVAPPPNLPGPQPAGAPPTLLAGLVLVHDVWGLDDRIRDLADALAGAGYVVLAPDLVAGQLPGDVAAAEALLRGVDPDDASRALVAAVDAIRAEPAVGRQRVGVIGIGMGAPLAAFLATLRADVAAVVLTGSGPDLPEEDWDRTGAAFLVLPPASSDDEVDATRAWAERLAALGRDVRVEPAASPEPGAAPPATAAEAVEAELPGALEFLEAHLG
jgi:dienelactone hydrolase